jgi:hypothetical protein
MMRPHWMGSAPEVVAAHKLAAGWAAQREAKAASEAAEAKRLAALWAGIEVGDYVELSEAAHVARGGLLLTDELGDVRLKQVQVERIEGDRALIRTTQPWGPMLEWVSRSELGAVVLPGLVVQQRTAVAKYWEEG